MESSRTLLDTPEKPSDVTEEPPDSPTHVHLTPGKIDCTDSEDSTTVAVSFDYVVHPTVIPPSPPLSTPSPPILSQSPLQPPDPVEELNRQISKLNPEMIQWLKDKELI